MRSPAGSVAVVRGLSIRDQGSGSGIRKSFFFSAERFSSNAGAAILAARSDRTEYDLAALSDP